MSKITRLQNRKLSVVISLAFLLLLTAVGFRYFAGWVSDNLLETTEFIVEGSNLFIFGEINTKTLTQFEEVITEHPDIETLVFTIVPGSNDDDTNFEVGRLVRQMGLGTHLVGNGIIESGGVDLFLSGVTRTMETGGQMGVHAWSDETYEATDYPEDSPEHDLTLDYMIDMGFPAEFYWFTIYQASADDMYFMDKNDLAQFGLLTMPIIYDTKMKTPFDEEMSTYSE